MRSPILITAWLIALVDSGWCAEKALIAFVDQAEHRVCQVKSWNDEVIVIDDPVHPQLAVDNLVSLTFDRLPRARPPVSALVGFHSGDRLVAKPEFIKNDQIRIAWKPEGQLVQKTVSVEDVEFLILELPSSRTGQAKLFSKLKTMPPGVDVAVLKNGDEFQGEFEELDETFLTFRLPSKKSDNTQETADNPNSSKFKLDRTKVEAIRFNPDLSNAPSPKTRYQFVTLMDGSHVSVSKSSSDGMKVRMETSPLGQVEIHQTAITSCQFYSDLVSTLVHRKPVEYSFQPYLSQQWPLVTNGNVQQGPLSIRDHVYANGLGMHSHSRVTYELNSRDREFRATVGIDDIANGRGSVRFGIDLDGNRVWTSNDVTGRDDPVTVPPVSLAGFKRLTLVVDFGTAADVSDYANWCNPILIQSIR